MNRAGLSYIALLLGIGLGIALGLFYAWKVNPVISTNVLPWQLTDQGQRDYMIAVSLSYTHTHDLKRTVDRLVILKLGDKTWQVLANTACQLARTSYASTNTGIAAIRGMVELAQSQGATDCASTLLPMYTDTPLPTPTIVTPTATLIPPATKTPTPTPGPTFTPAIAITVQSPTPAGDFRLILAEAFCNAKSPSVIQITVQDVDGSGVPAIPVQVDSGNESATFFTGLESERGTGFADFQMTAGNTYIVSLPGLSDRSRPLDTGSCTVAAADGGGKSTTSYRLTFKRTVTH